MKTTFLSLNFFCNSVRCGMLARHGPHHVAQNSTTKIFLPLSAARSTGLPLTHSAICSAAAGSPSSAETAGSARARTPSKPVRRERDGFIRVGFCLDRLTLLQPGAAGNRENRPEGLILKKHLKPQMDADEHRSERVRKGGLLTHRVSRFPVRTPFISPAPMRVWQL